MLSTSLYGIFLNPWIGFDVVNNSDLVIVDNQTKSSLPICNFFNLIFLSELFVLENLPHQNQLKGLEKYHTKK